jgi:hypothetical protein
MCLIRQYERHFMGITAYLPNRDPEFIASWKGYQLFVDALYELGEDQFPMILDQLPEGDEGETSAEKAAAMLRELEHFTQQQSKVQQAILVDSERGGDVSMGSHVMGGVLTMDRVTGYDLGFDERGFFVRDRWEHNRELFRAMRVQQDLIHPELLTIEYVDLDTGQRFRCNVPFGKPMPGNDGIPRMMLHQFHIENRPTPPSRFAYIVNPLTAVLEASVASNETIQWG